MSGQILLNRRANLHRRCLRRFSFSAATDLGSRTLTPKFVYLLVRSDKFRNLAIKSMTGASGRPRVHERCLDDFRIAHPQRTCLGPRRQLSFQPKRCPPTSPRIYPNRPRSWHHRGNAGALREANLTSNGRLVIPVRKFLPPTWTRGKSALAARLGVPRIAPEHVAQWRIGGDA